MSGWFTESIVEDAALGWLEDLGYAVLYGPDISPDGDTLTSRLSRLERPSYSDVILADRLRNALARLNPQLRAEALDDVFRKLTRAEGVSLTERNRAVHRMLAKGVPVEYRRQDGSIAGDLAHEAAGSDLHFTGQVWQTESRRRGLVLQCRMSAALSMTPRRALREQSPSLPTGSVRTGTDGYVPHARARSLASAGLKQSTHRRTRSGLHPAELS